MKSAPIMGAMLCIAWAGVAGVPSATGATTITIGQWNFESVAGYTTPDSSGNGNGLNFYGGGALTNIAENGSYSLSLPGGGAYLWSSPTHSDLSIGQNFTMTAWVNTLGNDQSGRGILNVYDSPYTFSLNVLGDGSGRLWGNVYGHDVYPTQQNSTTELQSGWNQVGMSYSNGTFSIYLNGNMIDSYFAGLLLPSHNISEVDVGYSGVAYGGTWNGLIDNVTLATVVPEPSTVALLGLGGLVLWRDRRRSKME